MEFPLAGIETNRNIEQETPRAAGGDKDQDQVVRGCHENSDPENSDLRPQTPKTHPKTQTPKSQTPKTQTPSK